MLETGLASVFTMHFSYYEIKNYSPIAVQFFHIRRNVINI